jgi:hypothetical protein
LGLAQSTRAYADMDKPLAWGTCDRCGFRYLRNSLVRQFDWRGNQIANLRILVCTATCLDIPQPQLRPIIVGPDPIPILDPRPGFQASQQGITPVFSVLELIDGDIIPNPPIQPGFGLYDDGGVLSLTPAGSVGWPDEDPGIPGALWSNGMVVTASLPLNPGPSVPIIYFETSSSILLAQGANNITTVEPPPGSGQIWVNEAVGGEVWVA